MIRNFRIDSCVTCLDFNYASNLILFGTFDNQIILYDMRSKNLISQILAHSEPITSVSFSKDSTLIMSSSYDGFW
jgi:COMPASS component SWD3